MKKVILWSASLTMCGGVMAVAQPILMTNIYTENSKATRVEVAALIQQAGPGFEAALQEKQDNKCYNKPDINMATNTADSVNGSFTRAGAKQKAIVAYYCNAGSDYELIGILEQGRVLAATYARAGNCSINIGKYSDINLNGTNELGIYENEGPSCTYQSTTIVDFMGEKITSFGDFGLTDENSACIAQSPGLGEDFSVNHQIYVSKGIKPLFFEKIYKSSCIHTNAKPILVKNISPLRPGTSSIVLLKLSKPITYNGVPTVPYSLIGSSVDLAQSAICKHLKCILRSNYTFPGNVTFINYKLQYYDYGIPKGLFSFQVDGKHRMIGFYSWGAGFDGNDLGLSKNILDTFISDILTTRYAGSPQNLFTDYGEVGKVGFDSSHDISIPINSQLILSNITAETPKANSGSTRNGSIFSVAYIADKDYSFDLSKFINRQTGTTQDIQDAINAFLKSENVTQYKTKNCGSHGLSPDGVDLPDAIWKKWEAYFAKHSYIETTAAEGEPYVFTFPGLAGRGVTIYPEIGYCLM